MIGVQLYATWQKTRSANCDMIVERVSKIFNSWSSGKFMPLNLRLWSINCPALSKVWFKSASVDLRVKDITAITVSVKSWLYKDLLEKPVEIVMYRPASVRGLNVTNVKLKALATMIRTFLETAAIPGYIRSLLHSCMYRFHILGDDSLPYPGDHPCYPPSFFDTIKKVRQKNSTCILSMSIGDWYSSLLEDELTEEEANAQHRYIPCRAEIRSPTTNWDEVWRLCRLRGLDNVVISFNLRLLHGLLVTRKGLFKMKKASNTLCNLCDAMLDHSLIFCIFNNDVGMKALQIADETCPGGLTSDKLLRLESHNCSEDVERALVIFSSVILKTVWDKRTIKSRPTLYETRSELEAKCQILRKTSFNNSTIYLTTMINSL